MSGDGTLVAVGTKQGITEKSNGWFEIAVGLPGKDYPLKISTKKQELVELARAAGENVMEWIYTEQDSGTPNPHRPGSNYINRYFEGVAPVGTNGAVSDSPATRATPDTARRATPQNRSYAPDLKDRMIVRQTALKAAAEIMAANSSVHPDYDPALEVMRAAARFETWVYRDIDPVPSNASASSQSVPDDLSEIPY